MALGRQKNKQNNEVSEEYRGSLQINLALIVFALVILAFVLVSAYANFDTWTEGKQGDAFAIFGTVGIGSEILGAILLMFAIRLLFSKHLVFIAAALPVLGLWGLCVSVNANASWEYFVSKDGEQARQLEAQQAATLNASAASARSTKLQIKQDRIAEIQSELEVLAIGRTPATIQAELNKLPTNYKTKRGQLKGELEAAQYRADLVAEITTLRSEVVNLVDEGAQAPAVSPNLDAQGDKKPSMVSTFIENKWLIVVGIMEFSKAFGFAIIYLVSENEKRRIRQSAKTVRAKPRTQRPKKETQPRAAQPVAPAAPVSAKPPKLSIVEDPQPSQGEEGAHAVVSLDGRVHKARTL